MAEMIIPGTYSEVRAEGLISAARVATGIVGVVGTAARGRVGEPVTLASFANARELFGLPDDYNRPEDGSHPLTLVGALEHIYNFTSSYSHQMLFRGDYLIRHASMMRETAASVLTPDTHLAQIA